MNIQQLEYILAVDTYRHFAKAAEHCRGDTTDIEYDDPKAGRRTRY